jgi:hypothetical protein
LTTTAEPKVFTWGDLRSALAYDKRVTAIMVAGKLGATEHRVTAPELSRRINSDKWAVGPTPEFAVAVIQAIDEVKADLDAGRDL